MNVSNLLDAKTNLEVLVEHHGKISTAISVLRYFAGEYGVIPPIDEVERKLQSALVESKYARNLQKAIDPKGF